ncbi:hypothetical protein ABZ863_26270 [Saccharomonospora sp. NPDC046836]
MTDRSATGTNNSTETISLRHSALAVSWPSSWVPGRSGARTSAW